MNYELDLRPYLPEELPQAFDELLADGQFLALLPQLFPGIPPAALSAKLRSCHTNLEVQRELVYPLLLQLMAKASQGFELDASALPDRQRHYTFVSNHRDIVLDSALLSVLLVQNGFPTTVQIAIGDNLLIHPWIRTLVRINKSFIVQRSLPARELLQASHEMSRYMHRVIREQDNIWIAQREGRAKDSDDRTQPSVLKMIALGGEGSPADSLREMNIVPVSISYEHDPCDYLKAREMQQKRDNPAHHKTLADDLENMRTGIFGQKGHVHYAMAPEVNSWLDEVEALGLGRSDFFAEVARRIDRDIHRRYRLFPSNYVAADLLENGRRFRQHYTPEHVVDFERYLHSRLQLIRLPQPDHDFLRHQLLTMYANPALNQALAS